MASRNVSMNQSKWSAKEIALIGLLAGIMCVLSPFSIPIPFSLVPISLGFLVIYFEVLVFGLRRGVISVLIYLLLGIVGLPVFTGFSGGIGKALGPTGGYLIGYIFLAIILGMFVEKWPTNLVLIFLGMMLGSAVCYLFGTIWYSYQAHLSFLAALSQAVVPFLPGDLLKMVIAMIVGTQVKKRLQATGLIG